MLRLPVVGWGSLLALLPSLLAFQCSLDGLSDGVRPSTPDGGEADAGPVPDGPFALIRGLREPDELAIAPDFLYFTTRRNGGAVERCPARGCNGGPEVVSLGEKEPRGLTVAQSVLVGWVNFSSGDVKVASLGSGASPWNVRVLATGQPNPAGIAPLSNNDAIWSNSTAAPGTAAVTRFDGTNGRRTVLSRSAVRPGPVIFIPSGQARDVVWGDASGLWTSIIQGDGLDGNNPCRFAVSSGGVRSLVTHSLIDEREDLYWATDDGRILWAHRPSGSDALDRCDKVQSTVEVRATNQGRIGAIAVDGVHIYYSVSEDGGHGSLRLVSRLGGQPPRVLLDGLNEPRGVVIDESYAYVAVKGDGTIRRVEKLEQ